MLRGKRDTVRDSQMISSACPGIPGFPHPGCTHFGGPGARPEINWLINDSILANRNA